tara:strand:+ start:17 stop:289 length:273 start_codon:yes stop_codon:yes gene_type:complete
MAQKEAIMRALREAMGESDEKGSVDPMALSPAQIKMLEQLIKQKKAKQGAAERKAFRSPSMMEFGGEVLKKQPKTGAVMNGRGGSFKGVK